MNRIARSIMMAGALMILIIGATGCDILNPKPDEVWHDGVVTNTGDRTLYCAFQNPDPEHTDYANQQLLVARTGSATYWLRERPRTNPYKLDVFDSAHLRIRTINIAPDAERNDHGSWDWTANAATGAVQFSQRQPDGSTLIRHYDGDGNYLKTVQVN